MQILAFSDIHGNSRALDAIIKKSKKVDLLVCCGDLTIFEHGITGMMNALNKLNKPVLLIHGNHETDDVVGGLCKKYKNLFFIHKKQYCVEDVCFIGFGGGGFSLRDEELEKFMKRLKPKKDKIILATHAPPYGTRLDSIFRGHRGSKTVADFIKRFKPIYAFSGHLHENEGRTDKIGKTIVINPGKFGKIIKIS
jgi:hypothetical protein